MDKGLRRQFCIATARRSGLFCEQSRNRWSTYFITIIILSGDINLNPGPPKDPCGICQKGVRKNQKGICCDLCYHWFHIKDSCIKMSIAEYEEHCSNPALKWLCKCCSVKEGTKGLSQEDEVGNIYENLANEIQTSPSGLKVGHLNVNGLLSKIHEVIYLLNETKFDVLAISETHLHKNVSDSQIQIDGYQIARFDRERTDKEWG